MLDAPVPQVVDQFVDVLKIVGTTLPVVPEQVIEVPKIFLEDSIPQMAEQLVDVPTVVCKSQFQQHSVEQTVDVPVHGGVKHARGGLQVSVPGLSSTAFFGAAETVGSFKTASQTTGAEKSVVKVPKLAESESVAEKAGTFNTASQKTEVVKATVAERVEKKGAICKVGSTARGGAHLHGEVDDESEDMESEEFDESVDRFEHSDSRPVRLCTAYYSGRCQRRHHARFCCAGWREARGGVLVRLRGQCCPSLFVVQTVQKPVETPQVQFLVNGVGRSGDVQRLALVVQTVLAQRRTPWKLHSRTVIDIPAVMQRRR